MAISLTLNISNSSPVSYFSVHSSKLFLLNGGGSYHGEEDSQASNPSPLDSLENQTSSETFWSSTEPVSLGSCLSVPSLTSSKNSEDLGKGSPSLKPGGLTLLTFHTSFLIF